MKLLRKIGKRQRPVMVADAVQDQGEIRRHLIMIELGRITRAAQIVGKEQIDIADAAAEVETLSYDGYADRAQMENIIRQITEKITISAHLKSSWDRTLLEVTPVFTVPNLIGIRTFCA